MKTKIATVLSLVGVLGAGSAAALVNTQILDNGPTQSGASAAVLPEPSSIDLNVPEMTLDTLPFSTVTTTDPMTTSPETTMPTVTLPPAALASGLLTAFNVGDAGVVTVDVIDGRLVLVSAEPKAGWTLSKAEDDSNEDSDTLENEVEVEFMSASVLVEFEAHLVDGQIVPKVESKAIGATANTTPFVPNTYDDDARDDHDDDDRDDDDHHDDDDDRDDDDRDDDEDDDDRDDD